MLIKNKILFSLLIGLSFLLVSSADAFSISPLKYTISLNPGDDKDLVVVVKNDSSEDKEYQMTVTGVQQDDQGRPIFKPNSDIAESWVKFKSEKTILKNNEKKDFVFTITIPKNAPPGAHYLGLGVQENNNKNIGGRLVTILMLQVAGTANESLVLEKFSSSKKYFFNKNLIYFLQIKNTGNVDLLVQAKMQIYNYENKIIDSSVINLGNKLFSHSNRNAQLQSFIGEKMFWPGLYQSVITINYGLTNQQIIGSMNFWYWPVWFLSSVVVVVILVVLIFMYIRKRHEKME